MHFSISFSVLFRQPSRPDVNSRALNAGLRRSLSDCQTLPKHFRTSLTNGSHDSDLSPEDPRSLPRNCEPINPTDKYPTSDVTLRCPRSPTSPTSHLSYYPTGRSHTFSGISRPLSLQVYYWIVIILGRYTEPLCQTYCSCCTCGRSLSTNAQCFKWQWIYYNPV